MKIGLVVYPGCVASGLFAFAEMLEMANRRASSRHFELCWVGVEMSAVPLKTGGLSGGSITPDALITDKSLDAILLPGFWSTSQSGFLRALNSHEPLLAALKKLPPNTQIWSYCTGVCLVAQTGRLDGQRATSTWWLSRYIHNHYPKVNWQLSQTLNVTKRDVTASGLNGFLPIALHFIEQHCGQDVRTDIVDLMVIPKPFEGANPFQVIKLMELNDPLMRDIFLWAEKAPAKGLLILTLAEKLNLTERTLARKVKSASGLSTAQFLRLIKLNQASELLIHSDKDINTISEQLGFADDSGFRRMFKKVSQYTPGEYRQQFKR